MAGDLAGAAAYAEAARSAAPPARVRALEDPGHGRGSPGHGAAAEAAWTRYLERRPAVAPPRARCSGSRAAAFGGRRLDGSGEPALPYIDSADDARAEAALLGVMRAWRRAAGADVRALAATYRRCFPSGARATDVDALERRALLTAPRAPDVATADAARW
ncbi:MAG: hypothetical protein U1F43_02135 [Myxococcota bacterium]